MSPWALTLSLTNRRREEALLGTDVQWEALGRQIC